MRLRTIYDLCCGTGAFSRAFVEAGCLVIGVDVWRDRDFHGTFILADVRSLDVSSLPAPGLVLASPPCVEYSQACPGNWKRGHLPDLSVWQACAGIAGRAGAPLILENVHGAQRWWGAAAHHYGHYFLWGDGVPALLPQGARWKEREKTIHRSSRLRAKIPEELSGAIAHHYLALWGELRCP